MQMQSISATDLDREGNNRLALREVIGGDDSRYHRVVFNEITKNAIRKHLNSQHVST